MLICTKEQGRRPSNQLNRGKTPQSNDPCPAQGLPHEVGGGAAQSGGGRPPIGAAQPSLALVVARHHAKAVGDSPRANYSS